MMISGAAVLLLLISAVSANDADVPVTDCAACNMDATCHSSPDADDVTPTCSCSAGFVGDGLYCYNRTACAGGVCCGSGYRWSSEQGCVDIDECASSDEACTSPLVCENTLGSFDCRLPEEGVTSEPTSDPESHRRSERSVNRNVKQHSVVFRCGGVICPAGQDCVAHRCRDPCTYNTPLNDPWRSASIDRDDGLVCDRAVNWQGWYRLFLGNGSVQMPETCVPKHRCGTHAPLWLPERHPAPSDGIVSSRVCGHWGHDCCLFQSNRIHIKACPGNYFVYKFVKPPGCHLAYCADPKSVCGTCRPEETCVSEDRVNWRCVGNGRSIEASGLVCGRSQMQMGLDKAQLASRGLDALSAHMADFRCAAHNEIKGVVWFRMERKGGSCGTQLRVRPHPIKGILK
ncbi:hypothetical protein SKAU_G00118110 [Synaphobranchus kaupii]|uniref:EGF-like domain-containing protein n=1 Tax=Synaphobranchus kaupii TaxID=118154 RepID=A0A9Q1FN16_SYNKA|nr:hypothetical protein SKAU_G00118110 [Synaphobranchus kaupii]